MMEALIIALAITVLYLVKRWSGYKAENTELKNQIASLKRQRMRHRRAG